MLDVATPRREDEISHLAHHMGRLMDKLMKSGFSPGSKAPDWTPAVDICEVADGYEVIVELAGMQREEIEVYTENGRMVVTGCRPDPCSRSRVTMHQIEIEEGRFLRAVRLPPDADEAAVSARYRDGMLRIRVPKRNGSEKEGVGA